MNDYKICHGDGLKLLTEIPDESINMVLGDLPYECTACEWDVKIPLKPLFEQYRRVIKPNGVIVLFGTEPFSSELRLNNLDIYKYDWVWEKEQGTNQFLKGKQPLRQHEMISVFYKNQPCFNNVPIVSWRREIKWRKETNNPIIDYEGKEKTRYDSGGMKLPTSVLKFNRPHWREGRFHPTQKPVKILEYLICTYTMQGDVVLDNSMGSGSTGVACINTKRKFVGIESDKKIFNIAQSRLENCFFM